VSTLNNINENIRVIRGRIAEAADKSGRRGSDITLVGVTKTIDVQYIKEMISCGVAEIGENRAQEITAKYPRLSEYDLNWHMIGYLQKNKVKYIADKVNLIQSVDSLPLAEEIDKAYGKLSKMANVLIEINIAGEDTKNGVKPESCAELLKNLAELSNIKVRGLMTIAPYAENPQNIRNFFKKMYELYVDIREKYVNVVIADDFGVLSMGMTNDYSVAIEEGSTMVRIGTGIFGERQ